MTIAQEEQTVVEQTVEKPDDKFTHIVNPPENLHIWKPGMTTETIIAIARVHKLYVFALCGWCFIPQGNPDNYPMCDDCIRIAGELMRANGE